MRASALASVVELHLPGVSRLPAAGWRCTAGGGIVSVQEKEENP